MSNTANRTSRWALILLAVVLPIYSSSIVLAANKIRDNLQKTDDDAMLVCGEVIEKLNQANIVSYCFAHELPPKGNTIELSIVLRSAPQGKVFGVNAAIGAMTSNLDVSPTINGKPIELLTAQAAEVKLALLVKDQRACKLLHSKVVDMYLECVHSKIRSSFDDKK